MHERDEEFLTSLAISSGQTASRHDLKANFKFAIQNVKEILSKRQTMYELQPFMDDSQPFSLQSQP